MQAASTPRLPTRVRAAIDAEAYTAFLGEIGYLVEEGDDFAVEPRMSTRDRRCRPVCGADHQRRYALNAANARMAACMTPSTAPTPSGGRRPAGRAMTLSVVPR